MSSRSRRLLFALATSDHFERAVRALPNGEESAFKFAQRYVAGLQAQDAFTIAQRLAADGLGCSIDLFGERVTDPAEAELVADQYVELAGQLDQTPAGTSLSLDLSHIGIDEPGNGPETRLGRIAQALPPGTSIQIGAEESTRIERSLEVLLAVERARLPVSATLQANLKRSPEDASRLAAAGIPVRLVKGAYVEPGEVAHAWGDPTDIAYVELAHQLHREGAALVLGTHDPVLRSALLQALPGVGVEMLLGVRPDDATALAAAGVPVRIYVPYGQAWFRYAMRRLAESRGA